MSNLFLLRLWKQSKGNKLNKYGFVEEGCSSVTAKIQRENRRYRRNVCSKYKCKRASLEGKMKDTKTELNNENGFCFPLVLLFLKWGSFTPQTPRLFCGHVNMLASILLLDFDFWGGAVLLVCSSSGKTRKRIALSRSVGMCNFEKEKTWKGEGLGEAAYRLFCKKPKTKMMRGDPKTERSRRHPYRNPNLILEHQICPEIGSSAHRSSLNFTTPGNVMAMAFFENTFLLQSQSLSSVQNEFPAEIRKIRIAKSPKMCAKGQMRSNNPCLVRTQELEMQSPKLLRNPFIDGVSWKWVLQMGIHRL